MAGAGGGAGTGAGAEIMDKGGAKKEPESKINNFGLEKSTKKSLVCYPF